MADWIHFESVKCDGPVGAWPIRVSGTRDIGQGVTLVLTGSGTATLVGTASAAAGTFAADYVIDVKGVPLSTGGQNAHYEGTATFANGTLTLSGRVTGVSHAENPFSAVIMQMMSSTETFALAASSGAFC
ncbi:MAG TPA: hypothetical protein VF855_13580 [Acidimicrobiales bacterium]